ncbi:MAG TPA: hypothetical protein P5572_14450 [Phycisphaerae bacterium]|nr:hypothetical protein [Phycisphaerae bacterium]
MITMFDRTLRVTIALLLAAPPILCRGGILADCCAHQGTQDALRENVQDCADEHCCAGDAPLESPAAPAEPPRKCGACAALCLGHFTLNDSPGTVVAIAAMPMARLDAPEAAQAARVSVAPGLQAHPPGLPFPTSDVPLLI